MTGRHRIPLTRMQRLQQQAARDQLAHAGPEDAPALALVAPAIEPAASPTPVDWTSEHDDASRAHAVRQQLRRRVPLQTFSWPAVEPLDQGQEGECVGYAVTTAHRVRQLMVTGDFDQWQPAHDVDQEKAEEVFRDAQQLDGVTVEHVGTSVLAGMKAGQEQGWWDSYGWAFGTADLAQAVLQLGPVVIGVPWFSGMYATRDDGGVVVTGDKVGGHCLTVIGVTMDRSPAPEFVWLNSFGTSYGHDGVGYVPATLMSRLLAGIGEAAIPLPGLR